MFSLSGSPVVWSWDAHSLVRSNDVLRFWWEGGRNKTSMALTWKAITDIMEERWTIQWKVAGNPIFHRQRFKSRHHTCWFTLMCGSRFCCVESQTTPTASLWIECSPSPSAVKTAAIFNHNTVHLSMVLPFLPSLSLFQPSLFVVGGVLIFHPTSNHHIDRLMGRPVGGQLEHAALAVVLFQAADELTTFINLTMIQTSCKNHFSSQAFDFNKPGLKAPARLSQNASLTDLAGFGSLFDWGHICPAATKLGNARFWSFKPKDFLIDLFFLFF